jgi:hypothetical protein
MLPYEYSSILKALKNLDVSTVTVLFEASSVSDEGLNQQVHHIKPYGYHNKRFFKLTEVGVYDNEPEIVTAMNGVDGDKTLMVFEGTMLPSKAELSLAKKGKFDLYTVTNFSFADLA